MKPRAWWFAALALAVGPGSGRAQQSAPAGNFSPAQRAEIVAIVRQALKADPSILRDAVAALQEDQQAKSAASSTAAIAANRRAIFADPADPVVGNPKGSVTLVEFFDVRCPYCRRMRPDIESLLRQQGDVRIVMKDLPVLGAASVLGAKALLAAQQQGGYAAMQQGLMSNGANVDEPTIRRLAQTAGLDWPKLREAMNSAAVQARIGANTELATKLGIQGTPAFVVGDQLVAGAMSLDELKQATAALRKS